MSGSKLRQNRQHSLFSDFPYLTLLPSLFSPEGTSLWTQNNLLTPLNNLLSPEGTSLWTRNEPPEVPPRTSTASVPLDVNHDVHHNCLHAPQLFARNVHTKKWVFSREREGKHTTGQWGQGQEWGKWYRKNKPLFNSSFVASPAHSDLILILTPTSNPTFNPLTLTY